MGGMSGSGDMRGRPRTGFTSSQTQQPSYQMPAPQGMPGDIPPLVNQAYANILGRAPDAPGAAYWQDQMANQGLTGQQLVSGFVNSPEFQRQQQYEQAYTQQFRPGPTGMPYNPNPNPAAPTTGPGGETLTTVDGRQGYYREATPDEIRRSSGNTLGIPWSGQTSNSVQGYDSRTRQVFTPFTPSAPQNTQSQQFFQPIYQTRYQNYQPQGFQSPFGGQMNPYGGFNPFMGFGGFGGGFGGGMRGGFGGGYGFAKGGGISDLIK